MPVGIDASGEGGVCFGIEQLASAVALHQGGPMLASDVEAELGGIGAIQRMAVHAHAWHLGVLQQRPLVVIR